MDLDKAFVWEENRSPHPCGVVGQSVPGLRVDTGGHVASESNSSHL